MHTQAVRKLLAAAVNRAIDAGKTTHKKIVKAGAASNGPLGRLRNEEDNVGIDTLANLADHLKVQPWQLIHPDPEVAGLTPQALRVAVMFQGITDERQRRIAYAMMVAQSGEAAPIDDDPDQTSAEPPQLAPTRPQARAR